MICEKSYCFVRALGSDEYDGSFVVNTSLTTIFIYVKTGEYFKTDFYIIWIDIPALKNSLRGSRGCLKGCLKSLKDNFL